MKFKYVLSNAFPAIIMLIFAYIHFTHFVHTGGNFKASHFLLIIQMILAAVLFVIRLPAQIVSWKPWDVLVSLVGTFLPSFYSLENHSEHLIPIGIQMAGTLLSVYSMICLGKSMGIIPANRGIKTHGIYRFVRHPLYLSYSIASFGYLMNHPNIYNAGLFLSSLLAQILRIYREEALLEKDPGYQSYKRQTKWRLLPKVY